MLNVVVHIVTKWSISGQAAVKNATTDAMCWSQCDKAVRCLHCSLDRVLAFCAWTASMNEWTDGRTPSNATWNRSACYLTANNRSSSETEQLSGLSRAAQEGRVTCDRYVQHCVEKPAGIGRKFPTFDGTQKFPPGDQCQPNALHILTPGFYNILCATRLPYCSLFFGFVDPVCVLYMSHLCMSWGSSRPHAHPHTTTRLILRS